jgi:hypothetical protein
MTAAKNTIVRSNGSTKPLPGWLGGWDLNVLNFTHQLGPTDFNIVNAYYLLAETADAWPTMREVADAVGVVLSTVHYRYHELAASGYLPRMGKSGIDELDEMPWRLAQVIVLHEDQPQAPTAPEEPEAPQEPEGGPADRREEQGPQAGRISAAAPHSGQQRADELEGDEDDYRQARF